MTRLALICCIFASWFATPASADTARVRSGEHTGFTRIVIDLPQDSSWTSARSNDGATVSIDRGVDRFDLTTVYDRITRTRVTDVRPGQGPGQLALALGCPCIVETYQNGTMLIIDVMDPPSDTGLVARTGLFGHTSPLNFGHSWPALSRPSESDDVQRWLTQLTGLSTTRTEAYSPAVQEELASTERRLIESVARAASQGLLKPQTGLPNWNETARRPRFVNQPGQTDSPQSKERSGPLNHMSVNGIPMTPSRCRTDAELDIANWTQHAFHQGRAYWRSRLFGEFDKLNSDAAEGLARHLLAFGFGAEALQVMAELGTENPLYAAIAAIVDDIPDRKSSVFSGQTRCNTTAAFWAILEPLQSDPAPDHNSDAAIRAFWNLPEALQVSLGYRFAQRLQISGDHNAADIVLRHMNSRYGAPDRQSALNTHDPLPNLSSVQDDTFQPSDLAASNTQTAPKALSHMVQKGWTEQKEIAPETATLVAAFAFENRRTDQARDLFTAEALALAASGAFDAAFRTAKQIDPPLEPSEWAQIIGRLIEFAEDVEFLKIALHDPKFIRQSGVPTSLAAADRLLSLGFAEQAHELLNGLGNGAQTREQKVLSAKVALARKLPRQAEVSLLGLEGPEVDVLRAQARDMAGDHSAAADIYASLDAERPHNRSAFLADDWPDLVDARDPALSTFAQIKTRREPEARDAILARNRDLISQSLEIRSAVEELLQSFDEGGAFEPSTPLGD